MFLVEQLALFLLLFIFSRYYYTGYHSFDFYDQKYNVGYKVLNLTYLELIENSLLLLCFYILR